MDSGPGTSYETNEQLQQSETFYQGGKNCCDLQTSNHLVCSAHFPGGIKKYDNNIPTIFVTTKHLKQRRIVVKHKVPICELSVLEENSPTDVITVEEKPVEQLY